MKQLDNHHGTSVPIVLLALVTGILSANALAGEIYKWTDENGTVHFVDRPPIGQQAQTIATPEVVPPDNDEAEPEPETQEAVPAEAAIDTAPGEEEPVQLSAAQALREKWANDKKERHEAQAEIEIMCQKHSKRLSQMEPARRVFYTNEQGESVRMDDELRVRLIDESRSYINENCD